MLSRSMILIVLLLTGGAFAQQPSTPEAQPASTPTPAARRRTFDQFDLSRTVMGGPSARDETPAVTEFVDQRTYEGIERMVKYAAQIEAEYRSTDGVTIDASDHFEPYRVLSRKLPALYRISEMFRSGLLDQPVLTNPANVGLLNQNQQIISEMQMISNSSEAQLARNQPKLLPIAERYSAPTYPVEKRPLITAMFTKLNGNFTRLLSQVSVRK